MAALEVHSGRVLAKDIERNDSVTFISFLDELDRTVDPELIHLILDNGSSHTSKATKAWIEEHTRFAVHYTPVHASWVNQVELVFSILTRKVLKLVVAAVSNDPRRWPVMVALLACAAAVDLSRLVLGVHYLTDVTGAVALAGACVCAVAALRRLVRQRCNPPPQDE